MQESEINLAVVPVAGLGTRLLPLTRAIPKEMLPIGRYPVIQHVARELVANGFDRAVLVTGAGKGAIEDHLALEEDQIKLSSTRQAERRGLGHAVLQAREWTGTQPFAVALGDSIMGLTGGSQVLRRLRQVYLEHPCAGVIALEEVPEADVVRYGVADPVASTWDGDMVECRDFIEKPEATEAPSRLAIAARYVFSPLIHEALENTPPGKKDEIQLTDAVRRLLRGGERFYGVVLPAGELRYDIGTWGSYFGTFLEFALRDAEEGPALRCLAQNILREFAPADD